MEITRTIPALSFYSIKAPKTSSVSVDFNSNWSHTETLSLIDYMLLNRLLTYEIVITPTTLESLLPVSLLKTDLINFFSQDIFPSYALELSTSIIINLEVDPIATGVSIYFETLCSATAWIPATTTIFEVNYNVSFSPLTI